MIRQIDQGHYLRANSGYSWELLQVDKLLKKYVSLWSEGSKSNGLDS